MRTLRWAVRLHKWIALVVGIQILLWIAGGVVMSVLPIEQVRGEHKIAQTVRPSLDTKDWISPESARQAAGMSTLSALESGWVLDRPVWRLRDVLGGRATVDALTGTLLSPADETLARQLAEADFKGEAEISDAVLLDQSPTEYGGPAPVWQVRFDDPDATTLYVDPDRATVAARRSSTWRFYDFFWKLHVMDYDDGADFNHPLLITASGVALLVAISGLVLLIIKMRRTLIAALTRRRLREYRGQRTPEP